MTVLGYNEPAWRSDIISAIQQYTDTKQLAIRAAGGEFTLKTTGQNPLFPDVLLYGDEGRTRVRHGWELKFPDTPIHDSNLLKNAETKARRLRVNSFLVWNVNEAALHAQHRDEDDFAISYTWPALGITNRNTVDLHQENWIRRLHQILDDLNQFFAEGTLRAVEPETIFDDTFMIRFLEPLQGIATAAIREASNQSAQKEAEFKQWWQLHAATYGQNSNGSIPFGTIADIALTGWGNRFVFCHYLKRFRTQAQSVDQIVDHCSIETAKGLFATITAACNFQQIFADTIATDDIGDEAWAGLRQLNAFLVDLNLLSISQETLHSVMEGLLAVTRRKVVGQFVTPEPLAKLLVGLAMEERAGQVLDPCCGTGTIARAVYELKRKKGQNPQQALSSVWASDKFQFPLQLCAMALADPKAIGKVVQIFQCDVFDLVQGREIDFIHPDTGAEETRALPAFTTIVSNLPFVRAEQLKQFNSQAQNWIEANLGQNPFGRRADLFSYILFFLHRLLKDNGRIGVIVSNAWLGTDWGAKLRQRLALDFHIEMVVASGAGRWFPHTDVVTNIVILQRKIPCQSDTTKFITVKKSLSTWNSNNIESWIASALTIQTPEETGHYRITTYTQTALAMFDQILPTWSSLFTDISWLENFRPHLVKASRWFDIARGERRGWNAMFYPSSNHDIEPAYIRPVLKSIQDVRGYVAVPTSDAFCCSKSISELEARGCNGTLRWIRTFETQLNRDGKPLPAVLARNHHYWYEMKAEAQADLVMSMNPEDRLFTARMQPRGFVDQRLIRFTTQADQVDLDLMHALFNSTISLFLMEASGFGRGLGALDLSASKIKKNFSILIPDSLTTTDRSAIMEAFAPVKARDVMPISEELNAQDRAAFDQTLLAAFGLQSYALDVRRSLKQLYQIRQSVKS